MHYHAEIWVPDGAADVARYIESEMEPHREEYNEDTEEYSGFWDWYQIGGRWTGVHVPDYDPKADVRNIEDCKICHGTGFRSDSLGERHRNAEPTYTCNGCGTFDADKKQWTHGEHGPGKCVKWPTEWAPFSGNVTPVKNLREDQKAYTLIVDGKVFHQKEWNGEAYIETDFDGFVVPKLKEMGITWGRLVTVDYHT